MSIHCCDLGETASSDNSSKMVCCHCGNVLYDSSKEKKFTFACPKCGKHGEYLQNQLFCPDCHVVLEAVSFG